MNDLYGHRAYGATMSKRARQYQAALKRCQQSLAAAERALKNLKKAARR